MVHLATNYFINSKSFLYQKMLIFSISENFLKLKKNKKILLLTANFFKLKHSLNSYEKNNYFP
ncbi:hypothetical protein OA84_10860 [Kaistella solincola]|uniref:Uncharacterized protein n=1 Tax=Kaistella solincola TaxID=510955 RepID=A0ABR4ZN83_9FLAO|nr:hypothetical protein OA84_10860 [Kaistella solincola]